MDIEIKAGDACKLVDGTEGVIAEQEGGLVCVAKEADGGNDGAGESGKGAETGTGTEPKAGGVCKLEDGSDGVVEDQNGTLVCVAPSAE